MICQKKNVFFGLSLFCSLFVALLSFSSDASAYEVVTNVVPTGKQWQWGVDMVCEWYASSGNITTLGSTYSECQNPDPYSIDYKALVKLYKATSIDVVEGNYYTFRLTYQNVLGYKNVGWSWQPLNEEWDLVNFKEVQSDVLSTGGTQNNSSVDRKVAQVYEFTLKAKNTGSFQFGLKSPASLTVFYVDGYYTATSVVEYTPTPDSAASAIDNQTQQQQQQYEQEKQEEQEREESASSDGNQLVGIFNITFMNPFAGLFELFNPGGCVNIPTIASWVGSDTSTYCSWFSQEVRATLTPVFGLSSVMILVGFVVSWLRDASVGLDRSTNIVEGFHGF